MWVLLVHVELSLNCLSLEWLSDYIFRAILEIKALELEGTGLLFWPATACCWKQGKLLWQWASRDLSVRMPVVECKSSYSMLECIPWKFTSSLCWFNKVATESTKRLVFRRKKGLGTDQRKWKSAAQWLRYRRNAVRQAVAESSPAPSSSKAISKMAQTLWSESHSKERQFNVDKEHSRRLLKVSYGFVLSGFQLWVCFLFLRIEECKI